MTARARKLPRFDQEQVYRPIERTTTADKVVERIERLIVERRLLENDYLPSERELAAMLGVSRNVLRESLSILGQKGLVETAPSRRTRVSRPGLRQLRSVVDLMVRVGDVSLTDLSDVRSIVEPEMAARAAERATAAQIAELGDILTTLEALQQEPALHVKADVALHRQVTRMAGNGLLIVLLEAVGEPLMRSMAFGTSIPTAIEMGDVHHREIYEAIARREPGAAADAMRRHMDYVRAYITQAEPGRSDNGKASSTGG